MILFSLLFKSERIVSSNLNHLAHTQTAKALSVKHSWKLIQFKLDLKWKTHPFNDGNEIIIEIPWTAHKMTGIFRLLAAVLLMVVKNRDEDCGEK